MDNGAGARRQRGRLPRPDVHLRKIAWVVYGPVSLFPADFGKLYVTRDGGQQWQVVTP